MTTRTGCVPVANPAARPFAATFEQLAVSLLFLAVLAAASLMPAQSDTFWQLRAGADTVATGRIPMADTWTHTVNGAPWPNHEWATEVTFYVLHRVGGFPLLTFVLACAVTWAWGIAWRLMVGPTLYRVVLAAVLIVPSAQLWSLRPQVVSLLALLLVVRLLVSGRDWWLPLVFLLWANFHGGVLLGFAALAGALAGRAIADRRTIRRAALLLAACAAAMCVTPLGIHLWTQVGPMVERIRTIQIQEWQPTRLSDPWNAPFWAAAVVVPWLTWRRRASLSSSDFIVVGACLALIALGLRTTRNVMPALMLVGPAVSRLAFANIQTGSARRREHPTLNRAIVLSAVVILAWTVGRAWSQPAPRLRWRPVSAEARDAIAACPPNLYHLYDHGGYLAWSVPSQRIFVDGRQDPFPSTLIKDHLEAEATGNYEDLFRRHQINCAALPAKSKVAARLAADGWRSITTPDGWVILTRK